MDATIQLAMHAPGLSSRCEVLPVVHAPGGTVRFCCFESRYLPLVVISALHRSSQRRLTALQSIENRFSFRYQLSVNVYLHHDCQVRADFHLHTDCQVRNDFHLQPDCQLSVNVYLHQYCQVRTAFYLHPSCQWSADATVHLYSTVNDSEDLCSLHDLHHQAL